MFLEQESKQRAGGCCKNAAIQVHEKQPMKILASVGFQLNDF